MGIPYNEHLTQSLTVAAGGIRSQSLGTGATLTSAADMLKFNKLLFVLDVGTLGASATVDFKLQGAKTSGGSYSDITGAAITQVTASNKTEFIELSGDRLQAILGAGYRYVKGSVTVGTAASQVSLTVLGAIAAWEPTSGNADASLDQTIVA